MKTNPITMMSGGMQTGVNEIFMPSNTLNPQVAHLIENLVNDEQIEMGDYENQVKQACLLKCKEFLMETI
jgi:hypothetical protein